VLLRQTDIDRKVADHCDHIADTTYSHAGHRGFKSGAPSAEWLDAEADIEIVNNKGKVTDERT